MKFYMYSGKSWSIKVHVYMYIYTYTCVYSKYIQPTATTTDLHVQVSYIYYLSIDQVIFVKCLFYATPVSCLEIRLKNVFQSLFI